MSNMRSDWEFPINSCESLEDAADYCHDQHFTLDDISFDERNGTFSLEFWRVLYEEAKKKRDFIVFQIVTAPVVRTRLTFQNVDEMKTWDEEPDDEINTILYESSKGEINVNCCKGTRIILKTSSLDGMMADIGEKLPDAYKYLTLVHLIEIGFPGYQL